MQLSIEPGLRPALAHSWIDTPDQPLERQLPARRAQLAGRRSPSAIGQWMNGSHGCVSVLPRAIRLKPARWLFFRQLPPSINGPIARTRGWADATSFAGPTHSRIADFVFRFGRTHHAVPPAALWRSLGRLKSLKWANAKRTSVACVIAHNLVGWLDSLIARSLANSINCSRALGTCLIGCNVAVATGGARGVEPANAIRKREVTMSRGGAGRNLQFGNKAPHIDRADRNPCEGGRCRCLQHTTTA
jgi:hypothetical protein